MSLRTDNALLLQQLAKRLKVTPEGVQPATILPGSEIEAVDGIVPRSVVTPFTVEQLSTVARFANEHELRLTPRGGGTQMQWGGPLSHVDILVDLSALNRIIDYQPADMTITVEAGCTLNTLQRILAERHQFLPIDPALDGLATLGGIVATNATGPLRLAHGTLRDYLIGVRVVRADGDIAKAGGRVVKNAAGYELCKLYTGSMGSLGILAELTFMVRPLPETKEALFLSLPRIDVVESVVSALLDTALEPSLLELLNEAALDRLPSEALGPGDPKGPYGLFVGFTGSSASVGWQIERALEFIADLPAPAGHQLRAHTVPWDVMHQGLLRIRRSSSSALMCRASLLSSEVAAFFDQAEAIFRSFDTSAPLIAHAGCGIVHIALDPIHQEVPTIYKKLLSAAAAVPAAPPAPPIGPLRGQAGALSVSTDASESHLQGLGDLHELRRLSTGNLVIESAPADVRNVLPIWGRQRENHVLMQEVKRRFDPRFILNKGRMVGG